MKYSVVTKVASFGAASTLACAPAIDMPPTVAPPVVAFMLASEAHPATSSRLDTLLAASRESRGVVSLLSGGDSVQHMAAIHVIASAASPESLPTPPPVEERRSVAPPPTISFRFGESAPLLSCTVLRACIIELEAAEALVDDPIAGDQVRWIITTARTGKGGASTLVIVKPKACDVTTNLVLSTDRRIYDLDLDSPPCPAHATNPKRAYTRHIRFSYPNESDSINVRAVVESELSMSADSLSPEPADFLTGDTTSQSDTVLNTRYRVVRESRAPFGLFGRKRAAFPWQPTRIADDGTHVYVSLPSAARKYPSPVFYALEEDGSRTLVNYTLRDTVIVTDRVFRRGVLVIPSGNEEQRLVFENRAWYETLQSRESR